MDSRRGDGGRTRKKRKTGRNVLIVVLVLVLLAVLGIGVYAFYVANLWDSGSQGVTDEEAFGGDRPDPEGTGTNILLLGSDTRAEGDDLEDARGSRSDTIMVMHLPEDSSGVQIMSIPRDAWVEVEGHGQAKINAAMSYGGLSLATSTISDFIGAPIHHVAVIDFEGFQALTDSLGGVDVESEQAFSVDGHTFDEGTNHLNGEEALAFVRARKQFADGDLQRVRNQQAFLTGIMNEIISADTLSNPNKVAGMVRDFSPYMTVDSGLSASKIASMAFGMRDIRSGDIEFFSAPVSGLGTSSDGQSYLTIDEGELGKVRDAFKNDTVDEYAAAAESQHL
nr:LCP family protein [Brevibacterium daeguense]